MTTARDVIAKAAYAHWRGDDCKGTPDWKDMGPEVQDRWLAKADYILVAIKSAPDSVRHELAALLNPKDMIFDADECYRLLLACDAYARDYFPATAGEADNLERMTAVRDRLRSWYDERRIEVGNSPVYSTLPAPPKEDKA